MSEATTTQDTSVPTPEQQASAATAGPQPSLSAAIAGTPNTGTATAAAPAPAPAPPSPQQQASAADVDHHSRLGRVAAALLGKQKEFSVDPQTGQTVTTEVPQKPGDLFRHILAGAILGGAAAHQGQVSVDPVTGQRTRMASGPLAGFFAGGTAVMEANAAGEKSRYERAEQQFKNQQTARTETREDARLKDERTKTTAQMEFWNQEALHHDREANIREAEYHEKHNERMQLIRDKATEAGAIDAPIQGNGTVGNGAKFQKLFTDQPELFAAPDGYNRVLTTDTNMDGLKFDAKKGYVDQDGNFVDLKDRTTWYVQFLPQQAAKQPMDVKGSDINRVFPKVTGGLADPKKVYKMPLEQVVGIGTKEHETNRKEATEIWHANHDAIMAQLGELKSKADNYTRQADAAEREFDLKTAKELRQKAADAYDAYDQVQQQAHPQSRARKTDSGRNNPSKVGDIGMVNGQKMKITKLDTNGKPVAGIPVQ
jgi:hypothetical protein